MDETAETTKPDGLNNGTKVAGEITEEVYGGDDDEAWDLLSRSFRQAQTVLDENRALIDEVNRNHESKIPDNMTKNVGLISQIQANISKVRSIYSDLSVDFSNNVRQRHVAAVTHRHRDGDLEEDEDKEENSDDASAEHVPVKSKMVQWIAAEMHSTLSAYKIEVFLSMFDLVFFHGCSVFLFFCFKGDHNSQ